MNKLTWAARLAPLLILPFFLSADVGAESQIKIEIGAAGYFWASNPSGGEQRYAKGYVKTQSDDANVSTIKYRPGKTKPGRVKLNLHWDLQPAAVDWLNEASSSLTNRKAVSIVQKNRELDAQRKQMLDVNLVEVVFPGPDRTKTKPEAIEFVLDAGFIGTGEPAGENIGEPTAKNWMPGNFKFRVAEPGLEAKSIGVIRCEPYGFTTEAWDLDGDGLPDGIEVRTTDLVVQVSPEDVPYFESWMESFRKILDYGEAGDVTRLERRVMVTYILSDKTEVDVLLSGVGLLAVTRNGKGAEVRMYSERTIVAGVKKPS